MEVTQKIKNLLWPNDLSKCSEEALPHVRSLAKQYGAVVHMLYVVEDLAHHESWYGEFGCVVYFPSFKRASRSSGGIRSIYNKTNTAIKANSEPAAPA